MKPFGWLFGLALFFGGFVSAQDTTGSPLHDWILEARAASSLTALVEIHLQNIESPDFLTRETATHRLMKMGAEIRVDVDSYPATSPDSALRRDLILAALKKVKIRTPIGFPAALEEELNAPSSNTIPSLVTLLHHSNLHLCFRAAHALRSITGTNHQFAAFNSAAKRTAAIARWNTWLDQHPNRQPPTPRPVTDADRTPPLLVADHLAGRLMVIDASGNETWSLQLDDPTGTCAATARETFLLSTFGDDLLIEIDPTGSVVWRWPRPDGDSFLNASVFAILEEADRTLLLGLSHAEPLVAVRINREGDVLERFVLPPNATDSPIIPGLLPMGNRLFCPDHAHGCVWMFPGPAVADAPGERWLDIKGPRILRRLPNGNALLACSDAILEISPASVILKRWESSTVFFREKVILTILDAIRMPDGKNAVLLKDKGLVLFDIDGNRTVLKAFETLPFGTLAIAPEWLVRGPAKGAP